jgi:hypothetical protein
MKQHPRRAGVVTLAALEGGATPQARGPAQQEKSLFNQIIWEASSPDHTFQEWSSG